jgi:type IV fimbrial biogenesis protein FimT
MVYRSRSAAKGFTLVELMITIAIAAIFASLAAPGFRQLIASQRIRTASFDFVSALGYARSEAVKRNTTVTLRAGASADGAWNTGWRVVDPSNTAVILRSWNAGSNLALTEKASNQTTVQFGLDGRMPAGSTQPKLQIEPSSAISGVTARCVQVDLTGRPSSSTVACP